VGRSCLNCHTPHASIDSGSLLKKPVPGLCTSCHRTDQPMFQKAHMGYPVAKSDCTSCHDPHGSSQPGILWTSVHPPVAARNCAQCHNEASSPDALKLRRQGLDACRGCHSELVNEALAQNRIHWPVVDRKACLNCHRPHASKETRLLVAGEMQLCGNCHGDLTKHVAASEAQHPPVAEGSCTTCHAPHGSNTESILVAENIVALCGNCHEWANHTAHPIGPEVVDPRNRNTRVECVSCHDVHGSPYKYITWQDKKMDLCVGCHQDFRK
jgi:predicted CXXCH cytochrome family protein